MDAQTKHKKRVLPESVPHAKSGDSSAVASVETEHVKSNDFDIQKKKKKLKVEEEFNTHDNKNKHVHKLADVSKESTGSSSSSSSSSRSSSSNKRASDVDGNAAKQTAAGRGNNNQKSKHQPSNKKGAGGGGGGGVGKEEDATDDFDLDAMFSSIKTKKAEKKAEILADAKEEASKRQKRIDDESRIQEKIKKLEEKGHKANRLKDPDSPQPLRFDSTLGLPIYSEATLGINKAGAGETPECPFDCKCCY